MKMLRTAVGLVLMLMLYKNCMKNIKTEKKVFPSDDNFDHYFSGNLLWRPVVMLMC